MVKSNSSCWLVRLRLTRLHQKNAVVAEKAIFLLKWRGFAEMARFTAASIVIVQQQQKVTS